VLARASGGMADAHGSGPCVRKDVGVQLPPCPRQSWDSPGSPGGRVPVPPCEQQHMPCRVRRRRRAASISSGRPGCAGDCRRPGARHQCVHARHDRGPPARAVSPVLRCRRRPGWCSSMAGASSAKNSPTRWPSEQVTTTRLTLLWPMRCTRAATSSLGRTVEIPKRTSPATGVLAPPCSSCSRRSVPRTTPAGLSTITGRSRRPSPRSAPPRRWRRRRRWARCDG
jgi:hypothetical protein